MRITESQLRKVIRKVLQEEEKPGKEKVDTKGTFDIGKFSSVLGVDKDKLASAVRAAKIGKRTPEHNAIFGDVFVKLMKADPKDTTTVMNVLKKISSSEESEGEEK